MSVLHDSAALIRIEAYDTMHAGALVQALVGQFDAEEISLDAERLEVEIRPSGDSDAAVVRALEAVDGWLATDGLDATVVHVLGHSYRINGRGSQGRDR